MTNGPSGTSPFTHTVVLASAGTGKTYRLTARYIGLLRKGVKPEEILAVTFTRKAAGEILWRVARRLADAVLDGKARSVLAKETGGGGLDPREAEALLACFLDGLHRARISTLDAFFAGLVRLHPLETGILPGWTILEGPEETALREQALHGFLLARNRRLPALLRAVKGGLFTRSVRDTVNAFLDEGMALLSRAGKGRTFGVLSGKKRLDDKEIEQALDLLRDPTLLPRTRKNEPHKKFAEGLEKAARAVEEEDFKTFIEKGPGPKVLEGASEYYRCPIPPEIREALEKLLDHAAAVLLERLYRKTRGAFRILCAFDRAFRTLRQRAHAFRFGDVTAAAGPKPGAGRPGLLDPRKLEETAFRMDGPLRHLLLDEFQDTSLSQWRVLERLATAILSGKISGKKRGAKGMKPSFFAVGDVKQAIYGWRGGDAGILEKLSKRKGVEKRTLSRSYRSSPVIMDVVNSVFDGIAKNKALEDVKDAAADWAKGFKRHQTNKKALPGYAACIRVEKKGGIEAVCVRVRDTIQEILKARPDLQVGILFRRNRDMPRMIYALREAGIPASEEGGNPLNDAPAVAAALSLLVLADHPGHSAARFHVASSPLGAALGLRPGASEAEGNRLAQRVRRSILDRGLARTLRAWMEKIASSCNAHDLRRFGQLLALAERFEARGGSVRAVEFVHHVREEKVEDPAAAGVRVMTIHQAKGLEFDAVFLPELDRSFFSAQPWFLVKKDPPGTISAFAPESVCRLDSRLSAMYEEYKAETVREELCNLYVALTRAKHALYLYLPDKTRKPSFADILSHALCTGSPGAGPGKGLLFEHGDPEWYKDRKTTPAVSGKGASPGIQAITVKPPLLAKGGGARRNLPRRAPSQLHGGGFPLALALDVKRSRALEKGRVFHAWFELIAWLDEGTAPPDPAELEAAARAAGFLGAVPEEWIRAFHAALEAPGIRDGLSKKRYAHPGAGGTLELLREYPFAVRLEGAILQGRFDRLVAGREGERILFAEVIDFKTDPAGEGERPAETARRLKEVYAPQMEAYRTAAAHLFRLDRGTVRVRLFFTSLGRVEEV